MNPIRVPEITANKERTKQIFLPMTSEIEETNIVRIPAIIKMRHLARTTSRLSSQTNCSSKLMLRISSFYEGKRLTRMDVISRLVFAGFFLGTFEFLIVFSQTSELGFVKKV